MRISDWSSDVCSSDLPYRGVRPVLHAAPARWAVAARLQARRLDDPAGASAQPRGRAGGAERGLSTGFDRDRDDFTRGARAVIVFPDRGESRRDAEARLDEDRKSTRLNSSN